MEPKPNVIGRFGVPSLQVGFGAQKLKPKFSIRCKNCVQHWPSRTDYTPTKHKEKRLKTILKHKWNEKKRLEHIPQNKKLFSLILTIPFNQIYSQPNKND